MNNHLEHDLARVMSRLFQKIIILDRNEKTCCGVTLSQHHVIEILSRQKTLTMNELSTELGLAMSTLTRIIDVLVRNGTVLRYPDQQDRRKVCVELSVAGKELAVKLNEVTHQFWAKVLALIPVEKKQAVVENLNDLLNVLEKVRETCCQKT